MSITFIYTYFLATMFRSPSMTTNKPTSTLSLGLYHKAILLGMYVFSPVVVFSTDHVPMAHEIAGMMGYDGQPGEDRKLLNFYRTLEFPNLAVTRPEQFFSRVRRPPFHYSAQELFSCPIAHPFVFYSDYTPSLSRFAVHGYSRTR